MIFRKLFWVDMLLEKRRKMIFRKLFWVDMLLEKKQKMRSWYSTSICWMKNISYDQSSTDFEGFPIIIIIFLCHQQGYNK